MVEVVERDDGSIVVRNQDAELVYRPYEVVAPDGTRIAHESRGGSVVSVQAVAVGDTFVEISHLGDGPQGGELVMVVTQPDGSTEVAVGALYTREVPAEVAPSWPVAVDLAVGMVADRTIEGVTKSDLEDLHQQLLASFHG